MKKDTTAVVFGIAYIGMAIYILLESFVPAYYFVGSPTGTVTVWIYPTAMFPFAFALLSASVLAFLLFILRFNVTAAKAGFGFLLPAYILCLLMIFLTISTQLTFLPMTGNLMYLGIIFTVETILGLILFSRRYKWVKRIEIDLRPSIINQLAITPAISFLSLAEKLPGQIPIEELKRILAELQKSGQLNPELRITDTGVEAPVLDERARLAKFEQLLRVSLKLKRAEISSYLGIPEQELFRMLVGWADKYGFKLDGDYIVFEGGRKDDFIAQLEAEFASWQTGTKGKKD